MEELVFKTGVFTASVLESAATRGDIKFFRAVVTCLDEQLTPEKVRG